MPIPEFVEVGRLFRKCPYLIDVHASPAVEKDFLVGLLVFVHRLAAFGRGGVADKGLLEALSVRTEDVNLQADKSRLVEACPVNERLFGEWLESLVGLPALVRIPPLQLVGVGRNWSVEIHGCHREDDFLAGVVGDGVFVRDAP